MSEEIKKNSDQKKPKVPETKKIRTKLKSSSLSIDELESLNEKNLKNYHQRNRRNRVIIIILVIFLLLSIAGMVTIGVLSRLSLNCFLHVSGDCETVYYVDNQEMDEFRTPSNLRGYCILEFDLKIQLKSSGLYKVTYEVVAYQDDKKLDNLIVYEANKSLFKKVTDTKYESIIPISGNQKIALCKGIVIDKKYEHSLNVDNFKLDFYTTFEKID